MRDGVQFERPARGDRDRVRRAPARPPGRPEGDLQLNGTSQPTAEARGEGQARSKQPLLSVRDLVTVFPAREGVVAAANGVSFDVYAGESLGLVGESGSGKSVTCRSVLRLVPHPGEIISGSIVFAGRDLLALSHRELRLVRGSEISMIFQDPMSSLNPVYTVGDQIAEPLRLHRKLTRRQARAEAVTLLDRVGIPSAAERLEAYPHEFSGGMRQRVMIAIAISCRPKLLLADEPTTALDVTIQDQILTLLGDLQAEEEMAIVLVSHDLGVIAQACSRVTVMYAGYVAEQATTASLFRQPKHPYSVALLNALPELAAKRSDRRLVPIEGQPPDLAVLAPGCPFAPRCAHSRAECRDVPMTLEKAAPGHLTACPFFAEIGL
ncbi:MAG TPA: ABC transporter ATP-binding protein [Gaiellaceae bacterium]